MFFFGGGGGIPHTRYALGSVQLDGVHNPALVGPFQVVMLRFVTVM